MTGLDNTVAHQSDLQKGVQNVRYVCGPWGCRWAPYPYWGYGYGYGYGYYRPYLAPLGLGMGAALVTGRTKASSAILKWIAPNPMFWFGCSGR